MKALLDFIPLIAFFFTVKQFGAVEGAAALLVTMIIVNVIHFFRQDKKLDKQQWFVLILTILFCGITVFFNDDYFIKMKSPVINGIFSLSLMVSVLINKPLMEMALKQVFVLKQSGWQKLTLVWSVFFLIMAALHYYTAFYTSNDVWINFKAWGWIPIMLVFMGGQFMVLKNHMNPDLLEQAKQAKEKK